jgi:hypothetical protein
MATPREQLSPERLRQVLAQLPDEQAHAPAAPKGREAGEIYVWNILGIVFDMVFGHGVVGRRKVGGFNLRLPLLGYLRGRPSDGTTDDTQRQGGILGENGLAYQVATPARAAAQRIGQVGSRVVGRGGPKAPSRGPIKPRAPQPHH